MTSAGNNYVPKPRAITFLAAPGSESETNYYPQELSWTAFDNFLRQRSLRRVFYFAGGTGVFLAAWYLYRKLSRKPIEPECSVSTINISLNDMKDITYPYEEYSNNNADLASDKMVVARPIENKVVIHCCPRGFYVPSIATEPLKLETFLRVANIPYEVTEVNFCNEFETPFLTYGDKIGNDFRESIRILSEKFDVNLEGKDVTASRKTASHLVDISLENHFQWAILIWRWIFDEGKSLRKIHAMNALGEQVVPDVSQRVKDATKYHPIGQLDKTEFVKTIAQGIHDISAALGKHKYFQGQTPGLVDCHAFAVLAQIMWNMPGSPFEHQIRKYGNLLEFVKRMKEKYWPDWNELILKPQEFEENYMRFSSSGRSSRSPSASGKRKGSRSRDRNENPEDKSGPEMTTGSDEESSHLIGDSNVNVYSIAPAGNKIPNASPEAPTKVENEDSQENANSSPAGILKPGPVQTSADPVSKLRSGFITASVGSTKFPVEEVNQPSDPELPTNPKLASQSRLRSPLAPETPLKSTPKVQPQQPYLHREDPVMHAPKPSVKFANTANIESTTAPLQQNEQQPMQYYNSSFQPTPPSQIPVRSQQYPYSAAEISKRRPIDRQQQLEQLRHSTVQQQQQYEPYAEQASPQRHSMTGGTADDYRRVQNATPMPQQQQGGQYYNQPPHTSLPAYGQTAYAAAAPPQMFNRQAIPGGYPQQMHYSSPQVATPNNEGMRTPAAYQHQTLNQEQMQKAAQAQLEAYIQQQQRQQYQQQQQQGQVTFSPNGGGLVASFVTPYDPRDPSALLRF